MGKRGPKPPDMGLLNLWEFEFNKAFRSLRDGIATKPLPPSGFNKQELRALIAQLKGMTPVHYWLTTRRMAGELDRPVSLRRPPNQVDTWWAETQRDSDIHSLEDELKPWKPEAQVRRRKIWSDLLRAS